MVYKSPIKRYSQIHLSFLTFFLFTRDMTLYLAIGKNWKRYVSRMKFCLRWIQTVRQTGPRSNRVHSPYRRLTALSVDNSLVLLFVLSLLSWHSIALGTLRESIGKRKARVYGVYRRSVRVLCFIADEFLSFPFLVHAIQFSSAVLRDAEQCSLMRLYLVKSCKIFVIFE